jgi:hypothetical protein
MSTPIIEGLSISFSELRSARLIEPQGWATVRMSLAHRGDARDPASRASITTRFPAAS